MTSMCRIAAITAGLAIPGFAAAADIPGDKTTTARLSVNAEVAVALFEAASDSDWYRVRLTEGIAYALLIDGGFPFNADNLGIRGAVRNRAGVLLTSDTDDEFEVGGFTFIADYTGLHFIEYTHGSGEPLPTGYKARITTDCVADKRTRCTLKLGTERKSYFNYAFDVDWFKIKLSRSKTYTLSGTGENGFYASLRYANGKAIWTEFLDDTSRKFRPPSDGVYYISTQGDDDFGFNYRLLLRAP